MTCEDIEKAIECIGFENLPSVVDDKMRSYAEKYYHITDGKTTNEIFEVMFWTGWNPIDVAWLCGFVQQREVPVEEIEKICDEIIVANPKIVSDFKKGKTAAKNRLIGQVLGRLKSEPNELYECIKREIHKIQVRDALTKCYVPSPYMPSYYPRIEEFIYHFEFKDGYRVPDERRYYYSDYVQEHQRLEKEYWKRMDDKVKEFATDMNALYKLSLKEVVDKLKTIWKSEPVFPNYSWWMFNTYGLTVAI